MLILPTLRVLLELATRRFPDASPDWLDSGDPDEPEVCDPDEHAECAADRKLVEAVAIRPVVAGQPVTLGDVQPIPPTLPVVDLERECATVRYERGSLKGKIKRTLYPRVPLRKRRCVVMVHQAGVERPELGKDGNTHPRRKHLTCHRGIGPRGYRYRMHPLDVRLVAGNRIDRSPWHAFHIELVGNFEGQDGRGDWAFGLTNGRGRASDAQLHALAAEIASLQSEALDLGAVVEAVVPHIVTGRDKHGKPNRLIDPGSRTWAAAEDAARLLGLAVPAPGFALGGKPVPDSWRPETPAPRLLRG